MHRSFNIDEHLTEQHWQPMFLFSKPSVSIHVCCSYIELSWSKLHTTGDLQVGNWHVNCLHSSFYILLHWRLPCGVLKRSGASNQCLPHSIATPPRMTVITAEDSPPMPLPRQLDAFAYKDRWWTSVLCRARASIADWLTRHTRRFMNNFIHHNYKEQPKTKKQIQYWNLY